MAHIRTIKPDFFFDEELAALPDSHQLFYIGLWCHADRAGRLEDRPQMLRAQIKPYHSSLDANVILDALHPKFITRYEVAGKRYIQINSFLRHQRPHHTERPSQIPEPSPLNHGEAPEGREGKGRERKGREYPAASAAPPVDKSVETVDNSKNEPLSDSGGPTPPEPKKKAATPPKRAKSGPPDETKDPNFRTLTDHITKRWVERKPHPFRWEKKHFVFLAGLCRHYSVPGVMAMFDLYWESKDDWLRSRGHDLMLMNGQIARILDDPLYKVLKTKHERGMMTIPKDVENVLAGLTKKSH